MSKERLDTLLVKKGFFETRTRASSEVMAGRVLVNGVKCEKPGTKFLPEVKLEVCTPGNPYVSRGGLKMAGAFNELGFSFKGKVVLDVGASTGGFTHFALCHGAEKVYAVDVGYGQLDWSLRRDSRVINLERINARYLDLEELEETPHIATVDVSFISLQKIIPVLAKIGIKEIVALVKPQFEAGREDVGKKGVVSDPEVHREVLSSITSFSREQGYVLEGVAFSGVKGPKGNVEYFIYLRGDRKSPSGSV